MSELQRYLVMSRQRNGAKYSESEIKNDNFTVKLSLLFNLENSVIHSYLYNKIFYLNKMLILKYILLVCKLSIFLLHYCIRQMVISVYIIINLRLS